jgi:hypothetical protein
MICYDMICRIYMPRLPDALRMVLRTCRFSCSRMFLTTVALDRDMGWLCSACFTRRDGDR